MHFKTDRVQEEVLEILIDKNPKLYALVTMLDNYSKLLFNKDITITCCYRSPEENAALYAPNPEPINKPHTQWQAVDLRSNDHTQDEINKLLALANQLKWKRTVAICHQIPGNAMHFHVQYD